MKKLNFRVSNCWFSGFTLLFLLFGCTEFLSFDNTVVITGRVITRDEFGIENAENANVLVSIEATNLKTYTDANGNFTFGDLPIGSFDLIFTKDGYGYRALRQIDLAPGRDTLRIGDIDMLQPSSIEIQNFRIVEDGNLLFARGTIIHKFPYLRSKSYHRAPIVHVFYNDKNNVSNTNYLSGSTVEIPLPTNSEFNVRLYGLYPPYWKTDTYYYLAYGISIYNYQLNDRFYDKEKGLSVSLSTIIGKPSNIFLLNGKE